MKRTFLSAFLTCFAVVVLVLGIPTVPAFAVSQTDFSVDRPANQVLDDADVLSRASRSELERLLKDFGSDRVDARLITLKRLDYGVNLDDLGRDLITRWTSEGQSSSPLLLLLIETQNKRAAVIADEALQSQLPQTLLTSTGRTTMAIPLREGDRYRQASVDGLTRLSVVLNGAEDPGPPEEILRTTLPTNIPTQEETESSNATTWIVVLLVLGTIIPMATWWVFSR